MTRTLLSANLNKVATLRNTREVGIPDLRHFAELAIRGGADGLTIHPRPDQRHIRSEDVGAIAGLLAEHSGIEFNIEGNPFHGLLDHCRQVRPTQATLVPDDPEAFTSDHGWDFRKDRMRLQDVVGELKEMGIRVSLFADADPDTVALAAETGADRVELYTEPYAATRAGSPERQSELDRFSRTANAARSAGLHVNAGHDLNLENLQDLLLAVRPSEVSIGHALVADALEYGMVEAVRRYCEIITRVKERANDLPR